MPPQGTFLVPSKKVHTGIYKINNMPGIEAENDMGSI
jgi:hypothetical protein